MFSVACRQRLVSQTISRSVPQRLNPVSLYRPYSTEGTSLLELVKTLRKETKAGIADCRDALVASNNDIEQAKAWLMERAKKTASKKKDRRAQEGGMISSVRGPQAVLIEVNSETDFAAREPEFLKAVRSIGEAILDSHATAKNATKEKILELPCNIEVSGMHVKNVNDAIQQLTFLFKENIFIARAAVLPVKETDPATTFFYSYVHGPLDGQTPKVGKIATLVQINTNVVPTPEQLQKIEQFANVVSIQIVGGKPATISNDSPAPSFVDPSDFAVEDDYEPQLLEQDSVLESGTIKKLLQKVSKSTGLEITITDFARWELNQGKEKEVGDLAADVKSMLE